MTQPPLSSAIDRVRKKVDRLGICVNAPLSESEINAFETKHNLSLPSEYRQFLVSIGNGGEGPPFYGICKLGNEPSDLGSISPKPQETFPFTKTWIWEDGATTSEGTDEDVWKGSLILGTDGCGQYFVLVINGPERGNIWNITDVGIGQSHPNLTFLNWYERWLDSLEIEGNRRFKQVHSSRPARWTTT